MAGAFESVTKIALEEIIKEHAKPSKFGYILTEEGIGRMTEDLYVLLSTSRNLKARGDRLLAGPPPSKELAR